MTDQYTCETCGKSYKQKVRYEKHILLHQELPRVEEPETIQHVEEPIEEGEFRQVSRDLTKKMDLKKRQEKGVFFTPKKARERLWEIIESYELHPSKILEPSFGSGEFIADAFTRFPSAHIYGVELESDFYKSISEMYGTKASLANMDFLKYTDAKDVDLIVGNPPYFVTKDKNPACMKGRGNIFVQFIYKCLTEHLKEDGILGFVLPTSFYNCGYYEPCRKYMYDHTTILHVENLNVDYIDTKQDTMLMIVKKRVTADSPKPYTFLCNDSVYIIPKYKELYNLLEGTTTLKNLGFVVKTGEVVWNFHEDKMADSGTPLIYSTNIVDGRIQLHNLKNGKKQYIRGFKGTPTKGPAILISRGYGNSYKFIYGCIDDPTFEFYGENHTNVIYPTSQEAMVHYDRIKQSLASKKTQDFIDLFVGNGALSKTEIETILPIF